MLKMPTSRVLTSFILVFTLSFNLASNSFANAQPATYYSQVAQTVYDKVSGNVTKNYRVGKAANDLSNAANDYRNVSKTHKAKNLANRIRNAAVKRNPIGLAVLSAVAAVGWGITSIKQDLYGNDIQEFGKSATGTFYKTTALGYDSGWHASPEIAVDTWIGLASAVYEHGVDLLYIVQPDKNIFKYQINYGGGTNSGELTGSISSNTSTQTQELLDDELESIIYEEFTPEQFNEIYAIPDYVPNTITEIKRIQADVIQEAYPEELPTNPPLPTSVHVVPGTAPEINEVTFDETLTDTTPQEVPDTYGDPWEEFLPDGSPNPNYDPRTDINSPQYDPLRDPRQNEDENPLQQTEREKQIVELLKNIKDINEQTLQEQQQQQDQLKNLNKESTQQDIKENTNQIKDLLTSINNREKQEKQEEKEEEEDFTPQASVFNSDIEPPEKMEFDSTLITDFKEDLIDTNNMNASGSCGIPFTNPFGGTSGTIDSFCQFESEFRSAGNLFLALFSISSILILLRV